MRTGNHHTARRWAGFLRASGHRVKVEDEWKGGAADALIALHARKSADCVERFHHGHPDRPVILALTGTDLYRDIETSQEAQQAMRIASRLVVLQPEGLRRLERSIRAKARVVYQSSDTRLAHRPPANRFRVAVIGNLREEKDPFRAAAALARLPDMEGIEVVQVGAALSPEMAATARQHARSDPRYRWVGSRPHGDAMRRLAASHVLVVSSVMEGGANVICEAARIGVPVLASRVSGNVGMLGNGYPGYFPLSDDRRLARLIERARADKAFYRDLKRSLAARRALFAPAAEKRALNGVLAEVA